MDLTESLREMRIGKTLEVERRIGGYRRTCSGLPYPLGRAQWGLSPGLS